MPNHVQNILTIKGHKGHVDPMMKSLKDEESAFSFKKIIPMPEELEGTRSPANIVTEGEYKKIQFDKNFQGEPNPMFSDKGAITQAMSDDWKARFGADNWYDWTCNNWGTKLGAYEVQVDEVADDNGVLTIQIVFQTAWSSGATVLDYLARQFPTIEFRLIYADEDCGSNTGEITWKDGGITESDLPDYSMENYFECWGGVEDWECVDGEWKWKEDEDE